MLDLIDYDNLRVIGGGASAVVLTDGRYAIKIGKISHGDAAQMSHSGKYSVPVFFYSERMKIPEKIIVLLQNAKIPFYGITTNSWRYAKSGYAAILVCGLARPIIDNTIDLDDNEDLSNKLYKKAGKLAVRYKKETGMTWMDAHPYNMGYYNRRLVILDF